MQYFFKLVTGLACDYQQVGLVYIVFPKELAEVEDLDQVQIKFSTLEGLITLRVLNKETCLICFLQSLGGFEENADSDDNQSKKMWAYTSQNYRCWNLCSSVGVKNRA